MEGNMGFGMDVLDIYIWKSLNVYAGYVVTEHEGNKDMGIVTVNNTGNKFQNV